MQALFDRVDEYLRAHSAQLIAQGKQLQRMPEWGFCEQQTSQFVLERLQQLGIGPVKSTAITGRIATLKGREHHANVAFMAELDGIYCPQSPDADRETGVSHACGHHMQVNALLGVAEALQNTGAMGELDGDVTLIAVPAEEMVPTQILDRLHGEGSIQADCGKHELLRLGELEGIDVVLASHALVNSAEVPDRVMVNSSCNSLRVIEYTFRGKTAHSTVCPEKGINALNAAVLTINAIQFLRESFAPEECIRISCNITEGGHSIGNVPDVAVLEVVIATKSLGMLNELERRVGLAAAGNSAVLGCVVTRREECDYLPYEADTALLELILKHASTVTGEPARRRPHNYFSNDLGNVSQVIPTAQVVYGGCIGDLHSPDFQVVEEETAYVLPARVTARVLLDLLMDGCGKARRIKEGFQKNK